MIFLLKLIFIIGFIVFVCMITYKLTLPLGLKIIDLSFESPVFRVSACFFLAVFFFVGGIMQLQDFMEGSNLSLSRFFPLSFLVMVICVFLGLRKQNFTK